MAFVDPNAFRYSPIGAVFPTGDTPIRQSIARGGERIGQVLAAFLRRQREQDAQAEQEASKADAQAAAVARDATDEQGRQQKMMDARLRKYKALLADKAWVLENEAAANALHGLVRAAQMGAGADSWLGASDKWQAAVRGQKGSVAKQVADEVGVAPTPPPAPKTKQQLEAEQQQKTVEDLADKARDLSSTEDHFPDVMTASDIFKKLGETVGSPSGNLRLLRSIPELFQPKNEGPSGKVVQDAQTGNWRTWTPEEQTANATLARIWNEVEAEKRAPSLDTSWLPPMPKTGWAPRKQEPSMLSWVFGE